MPGAGTRLDVNRVYDKSRQESTIEGVRPLCLYSSPTDHEANHPDNQCTQLYPEKCTPAGEELDSKGNYQREQKHCDTCPNERGNQTREN
jgi:hypothetical protein